MKNIFIYLLVVLLVVQSTSSKKLKFSSYDNMFKDIQSQKNEMIVGIVTSSNMLCARCDKAEEPLLEFQQKASTLLKIHIIDCEKEKNGKHWGKLETVCGEGYHLPHITFFEQKSDNKDKQWPQDHIYQGAVDTNFFINFMETITFSTVKAVEGSREHRVFLDDKSKEYKVVYLSEYEETPLEIKVLSVQNRDNIQFAQIDSDSKIAKKYPGMKGKNRGLVFLTYNTVTKEYDQTDFEGDIKSHKELQQFVQKAIKDSKIKIQTIKTQARDNLIKVRDMKIQQFTKTNLDEDYFILLHLHEEGQDHARFQEFKDEYGAFFQIYDTPLTCEKCKQHVKQHIGISKFPALIIYPQGKKNLKDFYKINDSISFQELNETLLEYTNETERAFIEHNEKAHSKFYEQVLNEYNKLPVVWYYDSSDLKQKLFLHTITFMKKYKKTIRFARFADPPMEALESWSSFDNNNGYDQTEIFTVVSVKDQAVEKSIRMEDPEKSFLNIILYLDNMVEQNEKVRIKPKQLDDVTNTYNWEDRCRSGTTPCVIAMLSTHKKGKFEREKKQFEELKDKFPKKNVKWAYMDGYCRDEILKAANLTTNDIPTIIYYDNNKAKYKTMDKKWSETNNEQFIESIRRKNSVYKDVTNEFELGNRDCRAFNEKQTKIYEEMKQKKREEAIERERQNKKIYEELPVDYDEIENDDGLDQYGMKRDQHGRGSGYHDDDL